jgi:GNAT superfamily N-acetyltransferase
MAGSITPQFMTAVPDDAGRLITLIAAFHGESGREIGTRQAEAIRALLADPRLGRAWLCAIGDQDGAYGLAYFRHSLDHGGAVAILDDLYVRPEFRHRGLGRAMLMGIEADLTAAGLMAIMLRFDPEDTSAGAFYAKAGYSFSPLQTAEKTLAPVRAER